MGAHATEHTSGEDRPSIEELKDGAKVGENAGTQEGEG